MSYTCLLINKTSGLNELNKLDSAAITEVQKSTQLNFIQSFVKVLDSEFYLDLPQQLQDQLLSSITKLERKNFRSIFKDNLGDFKMPTKLVN